MTRPDIEEMKKRIEAATDRLWSWRRASRQNNNKWIVESFINGLKCVIAIFPARSNNEKEANARFIANARTDLPDCIAYIEYLENIISTEIQNYGKGMLELELKLDYLGRKYGTD